MENIEHTTPYDLLGKYLADEASPQEREQVDIWINASQTNRDEFVRFEKIWNESAGVESMDIDTAWSKAQAKIESSSSKDTKGKKESGQSRLIWRIAAVILLVVGASWALNQFAGNNIEQVVLVAEQDTLMHRLPDGSEVTLNANTTLTYPSEFTEAGRVVQLEGEAFFEVQKDAQRPFSVNTEKAEVKVLGTSFNVRAFADLPEVEVLVETGRVSLKSPTAAENLVLTAGDQGILNAQTGNLEKNANPDGNGSFWRTRTLIFKKTELNQVIKILNKAYNVNIALNSTKLDGCKLSTTFKDQSIDSVLDVIATTFNLNVQKQDGQILLQGDGC